MSSNLVLALVVIMFFFTNLSVALLIRAGYLLRKVTKMEHAKCIAHIASVTSNKFLAARVREIADQADSIEGMGDLRRIAQTVWLENGPTVVALWLTEQAEIIEDAS